MRQWKNQNEWQFTKEILKIKISDPSKIKEMNGWYIPSLVELLLKLVRRHLVRLREDLHQIRLQLQ